MIKAKPFLRWAGGKNWLTSKIHNYLPNEFNDYHEPFLGGGSIYFYLKSNGVIKNQSFLSDLNSDLINAYLTIKTSVDLVIEILSEYKNDKEFYYSLRSAKFDDELQRAVQFLFLNRTSFNGIYRVNKYGEYNVPFGDRKLAKLFDPENLRLVANLLKDTKLGCLDFADTLSNIKQGDLVFLDPPYTVAHENNGFVKYNQKIFAWEDQIKLKDFIEKIESKGAFYIMTNAAHKSIEELHANHGVFEKLKRPSLIGGKGALRKEYNELILTNTKLND